MIARRPRAPVPRRMAWSATASSASSVNSSSTPSISNSLRYCLTSALRGSVRILTSASLSSEVTDATTGSRPMNSGISPNLIRSSGIVSEKHLGGVEVVLGADLGAEAEPALADPVADDLLEPRERAGHDEQHVRRVDLDELLVRVLAPALRRHRRRGALQDLQQRLLHALAGDVAGDRRVLRLAGDLVDLVDVDDPGLGPLDVVVGGLDQLEQDVLDVLADVARLGQRRGVGDGERHVEHLGEGLREVGLAAAGRAQHEDVRLGELDAVAVAAALVAGLDPLVVVVDGDRERALGRGPGR